MLGIPTDFTLYDRNNEQILDYCNFFSMTS